MFGEGALQQKKGQSFDCPFVAVLPLGLEGADAPSRVLCLHPPNPLDRGHSWVRAQEAK